MVGQVRTLRWQRPPGASAARLWSSARVFFDAFNTIMQRIYAQQLPGFPPIQSLDDLAFFDRQRMEFAKRLHNPQHGIAEATSLGIAGAVHVMAVTSSGEIRQYGKHRGQVKTIR
jgi:hypothetical protein